MPRNAADSVLDKLNYCQLHFNLKKIRIRPVKWKFMVCMGNV